MTKRLQPADMPEIAVLVEIAHVAGIVPAVADVQGGLLEVVEIALHDAVALDQDAAVLAPAAFFAGGVVFDADLKAGDAVCRRCPAG